jgi:dipeptidyl aminopeptidase/acylaminoacyl peptidase
MKWNTPLARSGGRWAAALLLGVSAVTAVAATGASMKPFSFHDLVMLDRVSDPHLSPDGQTVVYQQRETDYDANKGTYGLWLQTGSEAAKRLTPKGGNDQSPRWSADGKSVYFLSTRNGATQVYKVDAAGGDAVAVTALPLDVGSFRLSADGHRLLVSLDMFTDCDSPDCTRKRNDAKAAQKNTGVLYDKLFIRHWDTWADGTRTQLFALNLDDKGIASGAPVWITKGIDGDVPSKPFGDDGDYGFSPDGKTVFFSVRIAGRTEPWSTNFDIYRVPVDGSKAPQNLTADNPAWDAGPVVSPDGQWLAYRAMKRAGFEADRFGVMLKNLTTGATHEVAPKWDRSADGLSWSADGKTLYTMAEDVQQKKLFAIDVKSGKVKALTGDGNLLGFDAGAQGIVYAQENLSAPAQLFRIATEGGKATQLTQVNADRLANVAFGEPEFFSFPGAGNDTVHGYVVKPVGYEPGKKYPVAFLIHGGPQGSWLNDFHYRWNPQTYAGAGFAVVTIDFHGSTGYGQAFTDAISGDWGGKPLEDLQKGWAYALSKYSFLDGSRACALGASYGGYMIYYIAGHWQQPWKCLVAHDGVFDNRMMAYSTEELWFDEWENKGTQYQKPENFERYNPVNKVGEWKVPMMVVQGQKDYRIPAEQGIAAFTALQRRGIPSQFLTFPDENHWVLKPQNSVQWHETVEAWIKKWTATP